MKPSIRISHLGLLESAPLLAAQAQGFFKDEDLEVELSCDLGMAAICGRLSDLRVDGACLPAQMPVLLSLGAGISKVPMTPLLATSSQDLAIVINHKAAALDRPKRGSTGVLKMGVLGQSSPGCHLVKRWLQAQPGGPQEDPVYVPLAASQLVHFFEEGMIDGFCGIDPLPALAALSTDGVVVASSATLAPAHPGSVVALRSDFVREHRDLVAPLTRALRRGREYCANPANRDNLYTLMFAQSPFAFTTEEHREAFLRNEMSAAEAGTRTSIRFEVAKGPIGVDGPGARFIEQACRAALGGTERHLDVAGEVERLYLQAA